MRRLQGVCDVSREFATALEILQRIRERRTSAGGGQSFSDYPGGGRWIDTADRRTLHAPPPPQPLPDLHRHARRLGTAPRPRGGVDHPTDLRDAAVAGRWSDRALTRDVKRAIRSTGFPAVSLTAPRDAGIDASDQRSYWDLGIPAVMVTDTSFVRNPNYHAPGDTAATLDYGRMARVVEGVAAAALRL
jgi:hypothetical protein